MYEALYTYLGTFSSHKLTDLTNMEQRYCTGISVIFVFTVCTPFGPSEVYLAHAATSRTAAYGR
jgi:hypothetical protein